MKEVIRYGIILSVICTAASTSLALVNSLTKEKIAFQAQVEQKESLKEVMPEGEYFEPVISKNEIIYYKVYNKNNSFMGAAFKVSTKGYSSMIDVMVGISQDGMIRAIKIISQNETPGLGSRITQAPFTSKFANKDIRSLADVDTIAGATISSRAVINSVKSKAEEMNRLIFGEGIKMKYK